MLGTQGLAGGTVDDAYPGVDVEGARAPLS